MHPQTYLDVLYIRWVAPHLEAELELDRHFTKVMTPDRAYRLGMLAYNDELRAIKLVSLASKQKKPK